MADNTLPPEVLAALQQGQVVEAIRLLRESTGLGLKDAKDRIDAYTRGRPVAQVAPNMNVLPQPLPPEVAAAMRGGQKIEAIRLMRETTGLGLKEAKEAVEAATASTGDDGGLSPGQVKSRGGAWLVAAVLVAAALAWYFLRTPR